MKKIFLIACCFMLTNVLYAQIQHGIKAGVSFTRIAGDMPSGSTISSLTCPVISYTFRKSGLRWGYFIEIGYSQSGFKEIFEGGESKVRVQNIDFFPIGIQFSFLSDWAKFRPILQTSVGGRGSFYAKATTPEGTADDFIDQEFDILWTFGGGVMIIKHAVVTINYGIGFLNALTTSSGWKNRQLQISACYFF